jgi:hypothetical protein
MPGGSLGETTACPLPRSWYPADSPCSRTDEAVTGAAQQPWVQSPPASGGLVADLQPWLYGGLALLVIWFALRAYEAYKR